MVSKNDYTRDSTRIVALYRTVVSMDDATPNSAVKRECADVLLADAGPAIMIEVVLAAEILGLHELMDATCARMAVEMLEGRWHSPGT